MLALVTPSSRHTSAPLSTAAPAQSMRAARRWAGAGIMRCAASAAGRATRPIQNSHDRSVLSTISPDSGRPMPPPMPNIALSTPMPRPTRSRGKVSRMIPKASGNTPAPTPWSTRPEMTTPMLWASPQTTEPAAKVSSTRASTRPLP